MAGINFVYTDAAILFCIPEPGCGLDYLVERYTWAERIGVPSYETVAGCLGRAVRAGAVPAPTVGLFRLSLEWFARTHRHDAEFAASELAMIEFSEELVASEWPAIGPEYTLPAAEFERAADHTRQYIGKLFAGIWPAAGGGRPSLVR